MPNWDGIEDVSPKPLRVWLTKGSKESDHWKPLRKVDCWALNESEDTIVTIDGGRYTADKEKGIVTSNYHKKAPQLTLGSAIWFIRKDPNNNTKEKKESNLEPILNDSDTQKIETLYQLAIEASSSFGKGIDDIINNKNHETPLEDGSIVKVHKVQGGNVLCIKKQPPGWLGGLAAKQDLQRGYGTYAVEGEDIEMMLGPVKHLYFVVHGVGESLWAREDVSMSSLVEDVGKVRMNVQNRQVEGWRKLCEKKKNEGLPVPPMPDRVEFIPIEWWDRIHSSSNVLSKSLQATTLPSIPALRGIANAAVFDVLMYLTPTFCEQVLDCVNTQITQQYNKFLEIHPNFLENGGKCSLIGHSLGSVICWDLLAVKKSRQQEQQPSSPSSTAITTTLPQQRLFGSHVGGRETSGGVAIAASSTAADVDSADHPHKTVNVGYQAYAEEENADIAQNGVWGPTLTKPMKETLPFTPENVVFLGSPLGMFLTLRGAHPVFDEFRKEKVDQIIKDFQEVNNGGKEEEPSTEVVIVPTRSKGVEIKPEQQLPELPYASTFTLPVNGGVYNVFHPSDPVAYRIEPLLLPPDTDEKDFPPPVHLTVEGEGLRFHLKAQEIGDEIGKIWETSNRSMSQFFTKAVSVLAKPSDDDEEDTKRGLGADGFPTGPKVFPLGGQSERVDFQLQRNVVDSEYLSAVTVHSTYFVNTDVQDFVMNLAAKASTAPTQRTSTSAPPPLPTNKTMLMLTAEPDLKPATSII